MRLELHLARPKPSLTSKPRESGWLRSRSSYTFLSIIPYAEDLHAYTKRKRCIIISSILAFTQRYWFLWSYSRLIYTKTLDVLSWVCSSRVLLYKRAYETTHAERMACHFEQPGNRIINNTVICFCNWLWLSSWYVFVTTHFRRLKVVDRKRMIWSCCEAYLGKELH